MSLWAQQYQLSMEDRELIQEHLLERYEALEDAGELATLDIDGEPFRYAVIPREAIAPDPVLQQRFINNHAYGFTVPDGERWRSFVLDEVPEPYHDIVASHEYVENREQDHDAALEREVAVAEEQGRLDGYLAWVEEYYPGLADARRELR